MLLYKIIIENYVNDNVVEKLIIGLKNWKKLKMLGIYIEVKIV